jgi:cob(I)alamin adenosyltransferase
MKLYTRTGDDGSTGLFGGPRVGKDHPRVEAYGTLDELNAHLGLAAAGCESSRPWHQELASMLLELQRKLLELGADLATPAESPQRSRVRSLAEGDVAQVEGWIDQVEAGNDPLTHFVLPGGSELAARLHVARCCCRRVERRIVNLQRSSDVGAQAIRFVNRLGDLLFAMARRTNKDLGVKDVAWP